MATILIPPITMSANIDRIDLLLQYALLVAGEADDYFDRELGPIHLIKYAYLADLFHAEHNNGETFTGINWQFYKFGPWSQTVNERIEPALLAICADKKTNPSDFGDKNERIRWHHPSDDQLLQEKARELPIFIRGPLKRDINKFGKDTPELLAYVYKTEPMLNAAPNEYLDFSSAVEDRGDSEIEPQTLRMDSLSNRQKKKFKEQIKALREKHKTRGPRNRKPATNPVKNSRYDDVYDEGMAWLNSLAGPEIKSGKLEVTEYLKMLSAPVTDQSL